MKTEEKIQKITAMLYACGITLRDCKDELRFAPPELSKAIGSLREAEQYLKITNAKMNVK